MASSKQPFLSDDEPYEGDDYPASFSNAATRPQIQAANVTPRTPGLGPDGKPLADDVFSLYELVTCALASRAWPNHDFFFSLAASPASHPDMQEFLDGLRRRRVDKAYDKKLFSFLRDLATIQYTANPGPSTEEAFMHADGVVDKAKELKKGMEELLQKIKEEKLRPAVRRKGVEEVQGKQKKVVTFPGDFTAVRRAIDEAFKDERDEGEGEKAAEGEDEGEKDKEKSEKGKGKEAAKA